MASNRSEEPAWQKIARAFSSYRARSFALPARVSRRYFFTEDGTRVAYYVAGREDGPPVVISAGLGGGVRAWSGIIERLSATHRLYTWDYRGLYASSPPKDGRRMAVEHHAADLRQLIEHLDLYRPVLAGWSMGVQVNLELFRSLPADALRGLILLHGAPGRILDTAFDSGVFSAVAPTVFESMRRHWRGLERPMYRLARSRRVAEGFMALGRTLGVMDRSMDLDLFHDMARDWVKLDLGRYADVFERLGEHDASDLLPQIDLPALVISGGRDKFTPKHRSDELIRALPQAQGFTIADATHFGPIEFPDAIAERMLVFLDELD